MQRAGIFAVGCLAFGLAAAGPAAAGTIDFTGARSADGDQIGAYSNSDVDIAFDTKTGFGKVVATTDNNVLYRNTADYSGDQALYAASPGGVFELYLNAKPNLVLTSITFDLGSAPNTSHETSYEAWAQGFAPFLGNDTVVVDGTSGTTVTFDGISLAGIIFQFGTNQNVGLRGISYTTSGSLAAVTPIPGALLMFMTALGGLGVAGFRHRRRDVAA